MCAETGRVSRGHWSAGFRVGALSGIPTSFAGVSLVGAMWNSCDTGVNSSANSMVLIFLLPVVWVLTTALWTVVHGALGKVDRRAAVIGAVVADLGLLWFLASAVGAMDYPSPACPDNIPAWWPAFVPL